VTAGVALSEPRVLSAHRDLVGESPVWDTQAQALYWVDIQGRHIHRHDWASGAQQTWNTPERVGCIALSARGGLVAAMETGIFAVDLLAAPAVGMTCIASIAHPRPNMRFNDGRCDALGRFWASTLCMDTGLPSPVGAWYCLDERGLSPPVCAGLVTPNGLAFSPDGRTMYFSDSHPSVQKIWASDYDPVRATVGPRRDFVDMAPLPGRPDGAAVDADGHYWICANDAGLVHRFDPAGRLTASVPVPVPKPSMCAFGGPQLDVLLVTSIRLPDGATPQCGAVFALEVGVRGRPEPRFSRFPPAGA
jgi:sugar lactone lactonase YvrE